MRTMRKPVLAIMIIFILCAIIYINADTTDADETEDQSFQIFSDHYQHEPFWRQRYGESTTFDDTNHGSGIDTSTPICEQDYIGTKDYASSNIGIHQKLKGNGQGAGEDWGSMVVTSHKMYMNVLTTVSYSISLNADYRCSYWQTGSSLVCRSYYKIVGYDSSNNIVSQGTPNYVVRYDTFGGYYTQPNTDGNIHSGGTAYYTISGGSVTYIKVIFITEGSWLQSCDGLEIWYTNIDITYHLFSGSESSRGDSYVTSSVSYPADEYIALELRNGNNNGNDYGTIRAWTPYLYFNNVYSTTKSTVGDFEIDYIREYWNTASLVFEGYFKVYYYDSSLTLLGSDTKKWIDFDNTINPPKTTAPSSSGTIQIDSPSQYNAKFIKVEVKLSGSSLSSSDGAKIKFTNFKLAGGRQFNTEVMFYYEANYPSNPDLPDVYNYLLRYQLINNFHNHLFLCKDEKNDAVDQSDFTGTNSDDVRANDFFIYSGHGGKGLDDTYMHLTRTSGETDIDDGDISDWGPETDIVFLYCCDILGDNLLGFCQRGEWDDEGLYYNHGILGFTGDVGDSYSMFNTFLVELTSGTTFALALERAFASEPWASIWDESWQANSDHLWDYTQYSYGFSSDESSNDGSFYERVK